MIVNPSPVVRRVGALALLAGLCLAPLPSSASSVDPGDPIDLGGTEIEVGADPSHPTEVEAGLWSFSMERGESVPRQVAYRRTQADSTVHVSVTATPKEPTETLKVEAFAEDGTSCGSESTSASSGSPWLAIGVDLAVGPSEHGSRDSVCLTTEVLRFEVGPNSTPRDSGSDLPMSVKVVEESALTQPGQELPPVPEEDPSFAAPDAGEDRGEVTGGTSFDEAPLLEPGTHSSSVHEGEQRLYRVHLDWGQTLAARVDVAALTEEEQERLEPFAPELALWFYNPMRRDQKSWFDETDSSGTAGDEMLRLTSGIGPVRYLNRYDDKNVYLPGDYYVSVGAAMPYSDRETVDVPFTLTVEAQGEVKGAPDYSDDEPFLVGNGERSTVASGNPAPTPDEPGWFNARHLSGLALGVFGLACLGFGAVLFRRRPA